MITKLKLLGFTELEAKCYIALNDKPNQTGYEVAKSLGVSRSNVYATLKTLQQKAICLAAEGDKTTYSAISIDDLLAKKKHEFRETAIYLKNAIQSREKKQYRAFNVEGLDSVMAVMKRSLVRTHHHVLAQIAAQDLPHFLPTLQYVASEGIAITLMTDKPTDVLPHVIVHNFYNTVRTFTLILDSRRALIGCLDEHAAPAVIETNQPALVAQAITSFTHHSLLEHLRQHAPDVLTNWQR